jgi:hypothetical protein
MNTINQKRDPFSKESGKKVEGILKDTGFNDQASKKSIFSNSLKGSKGVSKE